ncbi:SRPBCC domain-containing protein [Geodermatophilus sp. URMC 61]|uniref:SRPBCC domain-containing protein n=1 Tax=Geodermatophilus sp. URMC 61 TaxID=3423411 RepID=UPI00406CC63F
MRVHFHLETRASPEQVFTAFTDVSERRLEVWSKTLDPAKYEVRDHGEGWAVLREGSAGVDLWVLLRYEWTAPDRVTWTLIDSDHCDRGTGEVLITPRDDGGSRVDVTIHHAGGRGLRGRAVLLAQRVLGPVAFPRTWRSALDRLAG